MIRDAIQIPNRGEFDLEGWRLRDVDDEHIIDLRLGHGYMIYGLGVRETSPLAWCLILLDCAVCEIDVEVEAREFAFSCQRVELPMPESGPPLRILDGQCKGDYEVIGGRFEAHLEPFRYEFRVALHEPKLSLVFSEGGVWSVLDAKGNELCSEVHFSTGFNVHCYGDEAWWDPAEEG